MDKARVAVYARIMANKEDHLTQSMMDWKQGKEGRTENQQTTEALKRLEMDYEAEDMTILGGTC